MCDTAAIANYAKQAAVAGGANLGAYSHYVYAFPQNSACGFSGTATVGGSPSEAWINQYFDVNGLGHELGHNFGLQHSRALDCGPAVIGGTCTSVEYGDVFDIMGGGASAHINLYQKERLGWANATGAPPIQTVSASGDYWIDAYETATANVKGLKILRSTDPATGQRTYFYVEHRAPIGFDSYMSGSAYNVVNGVSVHLGSEGYGIDNYLLDMTPATDSWYDPAVVTGTSFTDPQTGVTLTTLSADITGAWVRVTIPSQPCSRVNPSVSVTPGSSPP